MLGNLVDIPKQNTQKFRHVETIQNFTAIIIVNHAVSYNLQKEREA